MLFLNFKLLQYFQYYQLLVNNQYTIEYEVLITYYLTIIITCDVPKLDNFQVYIDVCILNISLEKQQFVTYFFYCEDIMYTL